MVHELMLQQILQHLVRSPVPESQASNLNIRQYNKNRCFGGLLEAGYTIDELGWYDFVLKTQEQFVKVKKKFFFTPYGFNGMEEINIRFSCPSRRPLEP